MSTNVIPFQQRFPLAASRGIPEATYSALANSVYPGAKEESILMVIDYCSSRQLDPILKPVHIVPMYVKDGKTGNGSMRDVVMPGIGLYRIQADRSGNYAGADDPEFGPSITRNIGGKETTFPEWCSYTVYKMIGNQRVAFKAKEYWLENYATAGKDSSAPNAMWSRRPYAQLAKCAEAQALRKAWPEVGQDATAEEMEGKMIDITDQVNAASAPAQKSTGVDKIKKLAAQDSPVSFGDEEISQFERLCIKLSECQTPEDVNAWGNEAASIFPNGTAEYAELSNRYNNKMAQFNQ